jgi:hypothetical protein
MREDFYQGAVCWLETDSIESSWTFKQIPASTSIIVVHHNVAQRFPDDEIRDFSMFIQSIRRIICTNGSGLVMQYSLHRAAIAEMTAGIGCRLLLGGVCLSLLAVLFEQSPYLDVIQVIRWCTYLLAGFLLVVSVGFFVSLRVRSKLNPHLVRVALGERHCLAYLLTTLVMPFWFLQFSGQDYGTYFGIYSASVGPFLLVLPVTLSCVWWRFVWFHRTLNGSLVANAMVTDVSRGMLTTLRYLFWINGVPQTGELTVRHALAKRFLDRDANYVVSYRVEKPELNTLTTLLCPEALQVIDPESIPRQL